MDTVRELSSCRCRRWMPSMDAVNGCRRWMPSIDAVHRCVDELLIPLLLFRCYCCCNQRWLIKLLSSIANANAAAADWSTAVITATSINPELLFVGSINCLFSFLRACGGVFLKFLGCPRTNLVGNLPERKTLVAIAKQKLTPIVKRPMCKHPCYIVSYCWAASVQTL